MFLAHAWLLPADWYERHLQVAIVIGTGLVVIRLFAWHALLTLVVEDPYPQVTAVVPTVPPSTPTPTAVVLTPTATPSATGRFKARARASPASMPYRQLRDVIRGNASRSPLFLAR